MAISDERAGFQKAKIHITDMLIQRYEHLLSARLEYSSAPVSAVANLLDAKIKELKGAITEIIDCKFPEDEAIAPYSLPRSSVLDGTDGLSQ